MTIFTLTAHTNGQFTTVAATRQGWQILVETPEHSTLVRSVRQAIKLAAEILGPDLERAEKTGSEWGLYVSVGGMAAQFGRFPPGPASPQLSGRQARPSEPLAQIFRQWKRSGESPTGALNAALKIIEIYAERRPESVAA